MRKFLNFGLLSLLMLQSCPAGADQLSQTIQIFRAKAVEAQFSGNTDSAMENYRQALRIAGDTYGSNSPYLAEIYYDMGTLCLNTSNFNKAEEYLNQTVKLNPNSSAAHLRLAELMRIRGRADEAQKHARAVVAKHRDDVVARQELALAYERSEPPDTNRSYREYAALEQLIRIDKEKYAGKETTGFALPAISFPGLTSLNSTPPKPAEPAVPKPPAPVDKKVLEAQKKAAAEAKKKADAEAKKQAAADAKKAAADAKKAAADAKKALDAQKKADAAKKKAAEKKPAPKATEANETLSGLPANLHGKAVLLTPVKKKVPAAASSSIEVKKAEPAAKPKPPAKPKPTPKPAEPAEESEAENAEAATATPAPAAKAPALKLQKLEPKKAEMQVLKPKAGKHAPGLVPPPPPVMTYPTMQMMPPPTMAPKPPVKAAAPAPKKEEKPKVDAAPKEDKGGGADEDDFLLDWGGAKAKKK